MTAGIDSSTPMILQLDQAGIKNGWSFFFLVLEDVSSSKSFFSSKLIGGSIVLYVIQGHEEEGLRDASGPSVDPSTVH